MSSRDERDEAAIRHMLSRYPRPALTRDFSSGVLRRVRERETLQQRQRRVGARLLLGGYWLAAATMSVWIVGRLPWPAWVATVAWGMAVAGAPVAYAIVLFPERGLRPLLPPLER